MFSVVIPTCWFAEEIFESIKQLEECTLVDDIIIIDNNVNNTPYFLHNEKLRIFPQYKNIFVGESWNTGVRLARNNKICLLNDDIILNDNVFELVDNSNFDYGIIGLDQSSICKTPIKINPSLSLADDILVGFGCCIFLNKNNYVPIPKELKVLYTDNFLFDKMLAKNLNNYKISCSIKGRIGVTTLSRKINYDEDNDQKIYLKETNKGFLHYDS